MPLFLLQGTTNLIPKDPKNTQDPAKYRPITCLPTLYKLIIACIAERIYSHCKNNNSIAVQQEGCSREARGCKEQLIIDSVISNQAYNNRRNLFATFVDYKKAFDSVPHQWLVEILKIYKINNHIIAFLKHVMTNWQTRVKLQTPSGNDINTGAISRRRGIFQAHYGSVWL